MKRFLLSALSVIAMAGMAFAGNGTQASPYSVDEVVAMGSSANVPGVYVKGYIVGFINGMSISDKVFGLPTEDANQTNLLLADTSSEDDVNYCLAVQLPAGKVRTDLNLWKNPLVYKHEVILHGDIIKYFGVCGLKNVDSYEFVGPAPELGTGGGSGSGSGGSSSDGAYLVNGMDDFTIDNVNLPSDLNYVWSWDATYGAKASAYYNSNNYATESILISPEITLPADAQAATFSQALNYLDDNNRADYVNVVVREGSTGAWTTANVSAWPAGNSWAFSDNCTIDLTAYAGKTIQIGFRYTSSSSCAPTWEVKRLVVGGTVNNPGTGETPGTPGTPEGMSVTFNFSDPASLGVNVGSQTEIPLAGETMTNGPVTLLFNQQDGASTDIRLFCSSAGKWSMRFYKDTEFTVAVPEGYTLGGIEFAGTNIGTKWSISTGSISGTTWMPSTATNTVTFGKTATGDNPAIDTMKVYYNVDSGVEEVLAADDSEAVYFNLQGQKVNNPERGIFVKVVGGKAVKVVR